MAPDPLVLAAAAVEIGLVFLFALVTVYAGIRVFDRLTRDVDEMREIGRGNVAVGILLAGVVVALAIVMRAGVEGARARLVAAGAAGSVAPAAGHAFVHLLVALAVGSLAVRAGLWVFDAVTSGIEDDADARRGNVALAIAEAGVLVAVALIVAETAPDLATALLSTATG